MKTMIKKAGYFLAMFALAACEPLTSNRKWDKR